MLPFRTIGAFGKPHPARLDSQPVLARLQTSRHLRGNRLVIQNERHIRVRGVAGEDLDVAFLESPCEFPRNVFLNPLEMSQSVAIPVFPLAREIGQVKLSVLFKSFFVVGGTVGALVKICRKSGLESVVRQLLKQDGRQADSDRWPGLEEGTFTDHIQ